MEKISDDKKRLKSIVSSLQKSIECPVCLETVKPPFKVCVRGHGVCLECMTKSEKCPLCQESFILENLVCIKNVLEALPHFCCYSDAGCEEVIEPGNDHESFCSYRPIDCRSAGCKIKMPLNEFLDHRKTHHPDWSLCTKEASDGTWKISPESAGQGYISIYLFNNLFWICLKNDITEKQLKAFFHVTPMEKLEHDYYACITFKKEKFVYTYTLKARVLRSCEKNNLDNDREYCMRIPQKELYNFIDDVGYLHYSYSFFRK